MRILHLVTQFLSRRHRYGIVGRHPDINIKQYGVKVHGRIIIDYDRIKQDNPALYKRIMAREHRQIIEDDKRYAEIEKLLHSSRSQNKP